MRLILIILLIAFFPSPMSAQDSTETLSYHLQLTAIQQAHPPFRARYTGRNSLDPDMENLMSLTSTLFLGCRLWQGGEAYCNPELAAGSGFSSTRGIAGFPNGEIYRVDNPAPRVFIARLFVRQHFPLGDSTERVDADQNQLAGHLPEERVTVTAGRFSLTDMFDDSRYSREPRTQFLNWSIWSGGAWDYAADTRGYTWGAVAELHLRDYAATLGAVMVPSTANGPFFDHNIGRAYSLNLELVRRFALGGLEGGLHVIGFLNRAFMGDYRDAIARSATTGSAPDVDGTNSYSSKYGFVISAEQEVGRAGGFFGRFSWNDGNRETWAFTEIDRSGQLGVSLNGRTWGRIEDVAGIACAVNALSRDHRDYLAAGGFGFIIGDGALNYAPEWVVECYYRAKILPQLSLTLDNQIIVNPAYNRDRGPLVEVLSVRGHIEW